jgi:hypothetical protein
MSQSVVLLIDIETIDGEPTGRSVPVELEYHIEIDKSYGADADGNRGVYREEIFVDEKRISPQHLLTMMSDEVERALATAEAIFFRLFNCYP